MSLEVFFVHLFQQKTCQKRCKIVRDRVPPLKKVGERRSPAFPLHYTTDCIVLYYIVLYCIALYCIVLHCIVLYCIVLYCIVLYCILFSGVVLKNEVGERLEIEV